MLFAVSAGTLVAQNTDIAITTNTLQPSVKRLGINLGTLDYYDSGQTTQNLLNSNPGFEGQIWNSTIRCASGTATTCVDEDQWTGWPANFWNGATFYVFYGTAAGRTGTVTYSSAPGSGTGVTLNFSLPGIAPANGDYLIIRKTVPGQSSNGWWPYTSGNGVIGDNLTDLPPGTLGKQTTVLTAPGASDSASITGYFDSIVGKSFVQMNGTYNLQFKAKGTGGSNQVKILVVRSSVATYINQTVNLSNNWNTYNLTFTAAENGSAVGTGGVTFTTVGSDSFELDDVSLSSTGGDSTNTTIFRDPVVNALRTLQPGILRHWGGQLGDTLDNLLTPTFGRQPSQYSAFATTAYSINYGLHDFLQLCQLVGAEPWFVVPTTFSTTDAANLIEYLAGSSVTPYGYKRALLGQSTPWTQVFSKIHLEFGNEAWNPGFKGGDIEYSAPYSQRAQAIFASMRANPSYVSGSFDLVLGGQAAYAGRNGAIQNGCNNNDSFAVAPYTMNNVDSYSDNESLYGSTFAEPEAYVSSTGTAEGNTPGMVYQDYQALQSSTHPVPLSFYEINLSTLGGGISQQALNSYTPSLGAGLMVVDTMLLSMRQFGVVNQELFALPQYDFNRTDGKSVFLWGSVVDMGVTDRRRPQFLALQLANQALSYGATMVQTVHTGADPTWNQPLVNTVQLNGAHYLHSFAFSQGANRSVVVFNLSRSSALPVTFSGANAPSGTVQMQQLTSANPSDTNENANVVNITPSTLSSFNPASGLSLPPYSMTVLNWGGTTSTAPVTSSAPVISNVAASSISTTSATISWTTDQATTSQVEYGLTNAYGASSPLNSALSKAHSVTLTGLSSGTTYIYSAVSKNSSGVATFSPNFSFVTNAPAAPAAPSAPSAPVSSSSGPQISYIENWGVTSTGMVISWSTNVPSTSALAYGTSPSLGQMTTVQTALTSTHGITLTGLTAGTTYYFVAESADGSGNMGYSSVFNITTAGATSAAASAPAVTPNVSSSAAAPNLSYVASWGITGSGITISWSTDIPSTSAVAYGTTSALGQISSVQTSLTNSHGAMLTGLKPSTTYYFAAQSTGANGAVGYSSTYSFTTIGAGTPVISAVYIGHSANNQVSFSWTTSVPTTSYVQLGLTTSYNRWSALTNLTTNPQAYVTYVPSGLVHYQLVSTDAYGNQVISPDYTFVEP